MRLGDINISTKPTWELWLTRSQELGDGFCVFTNCEDSKDFCFVAAIGICVKEGISSATLYFPAVLNAIGDPLQSISVGPPCRRGAD
jgi:hypothetical protein